MEDGSRDNPLYLLYSLYTGNMEYKMVSVLPVIRLFI